MSIKRGEYYIPFGGNIPKGCKGNGLGPVGPKEIDRLVFDLIKEIKIFPFAVTTTDIDMKLLKNGIHGFNHNQIGFSLKRLGGSLVNRGSNGRWWVFFSSPAEVSP